MGLQLDDPRPASPRPRPMRVALFTDTLGDVNGVSRFIRNVADEANKAGRDLRVYTSTAFPTPPWPNIVNLAPRFATSMPGYEQLEVAVPPAARLWRRLRERRPDVIHISTPGPVGCVGRLAAKVLGVPMLGVYHTDFPAYVDRLFDDPVYTRLASWFMRAFYGPFAAIFTRSKDYADALIGLGLDRERILTLRPGFDADAFDAQKRDGAVWRRVRPVVTTGEQPAPISPTSVKALYVGRVSVEKNLPMLTRVWRRAATHAAARGVALDLIVVGDGPYLRDMREALGDEPRGAGRSVGGRAHFLGFQHGEELATIYASSDFFVFPSTTDTLGQVVMESQASGLPVLVTDRGGPREVVEDGLTGLVLPAEDEDGWAAAVLAMATNAERRQRMGVAAVEHIARYSFGASFERFWAAHENVWRASAAAPGA